MYCFNQCKISVLNLKHHRLASYIKIIIIYYSRIKKTQSNHQRPYSANQAFSILICSITVCLLVPPKLDLFSTLFSKSQISTISSSKAVWSCLKSDKESADIDVLRSSARRTAAPAIWWVSRNGTLVSSWIQWVMENA